MYRREQGKKYDSWDFGDPRGIDANGSGQGNFRLAIGSSPDSPRTVGMAVRCHNIKPIRSHRLNMINQAKFRPAKFMVHYKCTTEKQLYIEAHYARAVEEAKMHSCAPASPPAWFVT